MEVKNLTGQIISSLNNFQDQIMFLKPDIKNNNNNNKNSKKNEIKKMKSKKDEIKTFSKLKTSQVR